MENLTKMDHATPRLAKSAGHLNDQRVQEWVSELCLDRDLKPLAVVKP